MRFMPIPAWSVVLRVALGLLWLVHGLEKFGVQWPGPLHGGTGSVAAMLELMLDSSPLSALRLAVSSLLLPAAGILQYPVGVFELALGASLLAGRLLFAAAFGGALLQAFLWLGYLDADWPLQYPVIVVMHGVLGLFELDRTGLAGRVCWRRPREREAKRDPDRWVPPLRLVLAALWLHEAGRFGWIAALLGVLLLVGALHRLALLAGLALTALAWPSAWGSWPWSYYMVAAAHLGAWLGAAGRRAGLDALLVQKIPAPLGRWVS